MAHTHEYDCKACNAHFDSQRELDEHNRKSHGARQASSSQSSSDRSQNGSNDSARLD